MSNPTLIDLILGGLQSGLAQVEVAMDVEVLSFDASTMTASVRPCVRASRIGEDGVVEAPESPTIYAVPVRWPSAGGRSITWGLSAGDIVTAVIRSRSHDEVDSGGAVPTIPAASRRWSWSDAVIWPSGIRSGSVPAAGFKADGQAVWRLPAGEAVFVGDSTAALKLVIEDVLRPHLVALKTWADTHTHSVAGVFAGAATVTSAVPSGGSPAVPASADLASGRLKVDT